MKKIILFLIVLCMLVPSFSVFASDWQHIYVSINEVNITVDGTYVYARNFVHEGTTYLSLRDMGSALGYEVGWDGETSTAILTSGAISNFDFTPGEKSTETIAVLVNDVNVVVDEIPVDARNFLYNDTTYLALRDIGNATGFDVYWDEPSATAVLTSPGKDRIIPSEAEKIDLSDLKLNANVNNIEIPRLFLDMTLSQGVQVAGSLEELYDYLDASVLGYAYYVDEAKRLNISLTDEEKQLIDLNFDYHIETNGGKEKFIEAETEDYTFAQYEKDVKDYWEAELLSTKVKDYLMETEEGFKELKSIAKPEYEEELEYLKRPTVVVKHILIPFDNDGDNTAEKAKAEAIVKLLKNGEDFEVLLSQNNNDPGQTAEGYEVYVACGFVEEFENAALALKKGEISDIVETSYGYHIIKALDDYIYEVPFDEYFESAKRVEINMMYKQLYETWEKKAVLKAGWRE